MAVPPIPDGYHSVTPYLIVEDAAAAIDFYQRAFGAQELYRLPMKDADGRDRIGHAEIRIGDCNLMLSDEWPDMQAIGPNARGGTTVSFMVYGDEVDRAYQRALDAGARADKPIKDEFWGDRMGSVIDPFGHKWALATHVEDVPPDEMEKRMAAWTEQQGQ
ncbi:VOC family protein [Lysobacter sp. F6437]|uniref:VOC family protein n=1 Tax=Lysobacter sp. F6437 TaxID=3459296 RepID=UPI00403D84CE